MKRFFLFGLICCPLIFLAACQHIQNFMIVNNSGEEIQVQYELKDSAFLGGKSEIIPEITTVNNLNAWRLLQKTWEKMPGEQYSFDKATKTFKVKVKPYHVISIGWADPYFLGKEGEKYFDIKYLKISGENKELLFENSQKLLIEFQKDDYQITYK
jgi:hypothetical protein